MVSRELVNEFHRVWYGERLSWTTQWRGVQTIKCPFDLWIYQEMIHELRPDVIVETGTYKGGSALFMADVCEAIGHGQIITIDTIKGDFPKHPRITYVNGDSVGKAADLVKEWVKDKNVLVILDSDHSAEHVYNELVFWSPMVQTGGYIIVEDTNIAGNPVEGQDGDPMSAVKRFLSERNDFVADESRERYLITQNPNGYLRKV